MWGRDFDEGPLASQRYTDSQMKLISLLLLLLFEVRADHITISTVPCKTVADCWLDKDGKPIRTPSAKRGRKKPRPDCEKNIVWLRNRLKCENQVCVAELVGDRC